MRVDSLAGACGCGSGRSDERHGERASAPARARVATTARRPVGRRGGPRAAFRVARAQGAHAAVRGAPAVRLVLTAADADSARAPQLQPAASVRVARRRRRRRDRQRRGGSPSVPAAYGQFCVERRLERLRLRQRLRQWPPQRDRRRRSAAIAALAKSRPSAPLVRAHERRGRDSARDRHGQRGERAAAAGEREHVETGRRAQHPSLIGTQFLVTPP